MTTTESTTTTVRASGTVHALVRLAISLGGAGLCGVATFGSWKCLIGAIFVDAIGIELIIIGYALQNAKG